MVTGKEVKFVGTVREYTGTVRSPISTHAATTGGKYLNVAVLCQLFRTRRGDT